MRQLDLQWTAARDSLAEVMDRVFIVDGHLGDAQRILRGLDADHEARAAVLTFLLRNALPQGTRLILAAEDLPEIWRPALRGDRVTFEWGSATPQGWYEPTFTVHADTAPLHPGRWSRWTGPPK